MRRNNRLRFPGIVPLTAVLALAAMQSAEAGRFGTMCQSDFQNGWLPTLPYVWDRCSGFNNELDDYDSKVFYYNLHGAKWAWENNGDQYYPETVNLFYASTHGGGWYDRSVWAMWDQSTNADSTNMRLGDESWQTMILSTYSCETLKFDDGRMWVRMGPIFRGGLYIATGSYETFYDGWTTDETGVDYADDLQHGWLIKDAWADGNSDWYVDNDIAVMTVGTDSNDCWYRMNHMTWQNIAGFPRRRDNGIGYYCYNYWHQ